MMGRIDFRIAKVMASVLAVLFSTELAAQALDLSNLWPNI
jgi:hypothetical protein